MNQDGIKCALRIMFEGTGIFVFYWEEYVPEFLPMLEDRQGEGFNKKLVLGVMEEIYHNKKSKNDRNFDYKCARKHIRKLGELLKTPIDEEFQYRGDQIRENRIKEVKEEFGEFGYLFDICEDCNPIFLGRILRIGVFFDAFSNPRKIKTLQDVHDVFMPVFFDTFFRKSLGFNQHYSAKKFAGWLSFKLYGTANYWCSEYSKYCENIE